MARFFLGLTGASGHPYALRLLEALLELGHQVHLSASAAGRKVLAHETGLPEQPEALEEALRERLGALWEGLRVFPPTAIEAPAASGTAGIDAVVLCPCSMGTLARVVAGFSSNLLERAADVALKEGRRLVVVPRESPLSSLHLENLLRLSRAGGVVVPAAPGFYHRPAELGDLIDHMVGKILDRLGAGAEWAPAVRWRGLEPSPEPGIEPPESRSSVR